MNITYSSNHALPNSVDVKEMEETCGVSVLVYAADELLTFVLQNMRPPIGLILISSLHDRLADLPSQMLIHQLDLLNIQIHQTVFGLGKCGPNV